MGKRKPLNWYDKRRIKSQISKLMEITKRVEDEDSKEKLSQAISILVRLIVLSGVFLIFIKLGGHHV